MIRALLLALAIATILFAMLQLRRLGAKARAREERRMRRLAREREWERMIGEGTRERQPERPESESGHAPLDA